MGSVTESKPIDIRPLIAAGTNDRRIFRLMVPATCRFSCGDCPLAAQASLPRHAQQPAYLARIFLSAYRSGLCDGLFLMSGVPLDAVQAAAGLQEFVELLRNAYGYRGYIHVKVPSGALQGQTEALMRLVDRVSFQLDPTCQKALAPELAARPQFRLMEKDLRGIRPARFPRRARPVPELSPVNSRPYQPYLLEVPRADAR